MKSRQFRAYVKLLGLGLIVVTVFVVVANINKIQDLLSQAGGVKADIRVDTQAVLGVMPRPWANLAQGGEEATPMLDDVTSQVRALKTEYVRIDHIYDFYEVVGRGEGGELTFNWTKLDGVVDSILASGAKPFFALSYMPSAIASGDVTSKPNDYSEWSQVISRTVSHFSGRQNRNIADVYYEVWNEPDLFGGYRIGSYIPLYQSAAAGARAATNTQPYKFGGPATTGQYKNWFDGLMKFTLENKVRLDFYSWHRYSTDPGQFYKDVEEANEWLKAFPERQLDLELLITEWGHDSEINAGYDGSYGAAHTAAVAMEMVNRVDRAFAFEVKDGPDPAGNKFWGRWGLLTHESVGITAKPRYWALKMLADLADERLALTGKGTWVKGLAAKNGETTQVLLANFDRRGKHVEQVPVTFENLKDREFVLKESFLSGKDLTVEVATTEASMRHEVLMPASSVVMLELTAREFAALKNN